MKYLNFSNNAWNKINDLLAGAIWIYLCSMDKSLTLEEIMDRHWTIKKHVISHSLSRLIVLKLVREIKTKDKIYYKASKRYYFHTD